MPKSISIGGKFQNIETLDIKQIQAQMPLINPKSGNKYIPSDISETRLKEEDTQGDNVKADPRWGFKYVQEVKPWEE